MEHGEDDIYYASCIAAGKKKIVSYDVVSGELKTIITWSSSNTCYNMGYDPENKIFMCPDIMLQKIVYYSQSTYFFVHTPPPFPTTTKDYVDPHHLFYSVIGLDSIFSEKLDFFS